MSDEFLKLPRQNQRETLIGAEPATGIKPHFLEKDIWICWILKELFTLPKKMAFKGGTSLSKCYGLIDRFSEDVDVTIDYRELMPNLDLLTESKNSLKNKREKLKEHVNDYVLGTVLPHIEKAFSTQFENERLKYRFVDGERLYFDYPSVFENNSDAYVKDNVLIEFGGTNKTEPNEEYLVKPYLAFDGVKFPEAKVLVYSPLRTFWEKATLMHVECYRGRLSQAPERLSRHWYDLAKLSQSWVKAKALQDRELLDDVLMIKKAFFNASYANYEKCTSKEFRLVPKEDEINQLKADYENMIRAGMFLNESVTFDAIMEELGELQEIINQN